VKFDETNGSQEKDENLEMWEALNWPMQWTRWMLVT
jgi:hypothetical protein